MLKTGSAFARLHTCKHLAIALAGYSLLALLFTWPLAAHFTTHVPGDGSDDPALAWNLWWVKHALLDLHTNPLFTDYMFYPIGINLAYFTITLLNGLLAIPLQALFGLVVANNLIVLGHFLLSAMGMYYLAAYILQGDASWLPRFSTGNKFTTIVLAPAQGWIIPLASFFAGTVFAFFPGKFLFAGYGQVNVLSTGWIPFYVLYFLKACRPTNASGPATLLDPVLAGVFLLFNALSEYTYASFLLIFTGFYLIYLWFADRPALLNRRLARNLGIILAIFLAGFSPFLYEMVREMRLEGDYMMVGWGFADVFSADLLGFFVPSTLHPFLGAWARGFRFTYTNFATIGYTTLALSLLAGLVAGLASPNRVSRAADAGAEQAAAAWAKGPSFKQAGSIRFWGYAALAFFVLMLGPVLHINGQYVFDLDGLPIRFPLPFILLHYIPFFKGNRYPSRFVVLLMLCLAMLAAWGLAWLLTRTARRTGSGAKVVAGAALCLLAFDSLSIPLPLSDLMVPAIYHRIAQEPGDFAILELPLGWRNGFRITGAQHKVIMYQQFYQTVAQKRLLGGNTSRNPEFKFDYFIQAPLIRSFIALEENRPLPEGAREYDRAIAPEVLRFFNIRYVIVHPPYTGTALEDYARAVLPLEPVSTEDDLKVYRVILPPAAGRVTVNLADDLGRLYRGEGWSEPEGTYRWVQRQGARLFLPLEGNRAYSLALRAMAPEAGQKIALYLNGRLLASLSLVAGWQDLAVEIPVPVARTGLNELTISYDRPFPLVSGRPIGKTGAIAPVNIVVRSAGLEAGDYAHIYVNGRDAAPNRRGYNVVVIHPQTGRVERAAHFDTLLSAAESSRLADLLNKVPAGYIVAVAVRDEASLNLGQDAIDALAAIGAAIDLRGKFRWGHAVIGIKGAAPGTALEAAGRAEPVQVYVGRNVITDQVGLAVESIQIASR